ncbi:MAG: RNA polymerase sigma factor, partial [Verrucomicrobiota bacterium]
MARAASTDDPDAELLLRVGREGDEAALAALVARWQQPVVNFIFRMLPDAGEAEDLAQAVFVQLWRTAGRYQPQARFSTFLFTIARNLTLNEVRRRSRHPADSLEGAADPGDETPARQLGDAGQLPAVVLLERAELAA